MLNPVGFEDESVLGSISTLYTAGYVGSSRTIVFFSVPVINGKKATNVNCTQFAIIHNGSYESLSAADFNFSVNYKSDNAVTIHATKKSGTLSPSNNTNVTVLFSGTIS